MIDVVTGASLLIQSCLMASAQQYDIPPGLLFAVAEQESAFKADAIAEANNGTFSVGVMQINSSWFDTLEQARGIRYQDLADPCINIDAGAWILRSEIDRYGRNWQAIGAYYAGAYTAKTKHWKLKHYRRYASQVLQRWQRFQAKNHNG